MTLDLENLKEIAGKPPQIEWACGYSGHVVQADKPWMRVAFPTSDGDPAIMEYIAAFDPPTALALIGELEKWQGKTMDARQEARDMCAQRDSARALLKECLLPVRMADLRARIAKELGE